MVAVLNTLKVLASAHWHKQWLPLFFLSFEILWTQIMASPSLSEAIHTNGMGKANGKFMCIHFMLVSWQRKGAVKSLNLWKEFFAIVHQSLCHEMGFCGLLCFYIRAHRSCFEAVDTFYDQYFHFCWELALDTWVKDFLINSFGIHNLNHAYSLASFQCSGLSKQRMLLLTENCLQH